MPDLLIELFSEEIPARMQARAREDLRRLVTEGLVEAGLTYASAGAFSTPRRLVLAVEGLTAESPTLREERKGPRADAPEAAIEGFLRSTGLTRDQLVLREAGKAQVFFAVVEKPGRAAAQIVAEVLERVVRTFPWPKSMRWGEASKSPGSLRWVRPLHSILCLLTTEAGAEVVPLTVDHLTAGNTTEGHRFMAPGRFSVASFEDYRAKLRRAHVVLDSAEREAAIWQDATNQAFARGLEVVPDAGLLTEVAGLVEWPVVLCGKIDPRFLHLPPEVLQTSMREHQKFFSLKNPATGRIEGFVTVANRETADHGATILHGNQKVLSARLSDAAFFWENDLREAKAGMGAWAEGLRAVTFHNKLGSQSDRIARIAALAREIAPMVGADPDLAQKAAEVAKLDLRSAMVGEFPELQGLMGMHYARAAGLPEAVALAARDHYSPLGPSDAVPSEPVSVAVALADKIDTLLQFWWIGELSTGSKDPFALRRAALGTIRLMLSSSARINLTRALRGALWRILHEHDNNYGSILAVGAAFEASEDEGFEMKTLVRKYRHIRSPEELFDVALHPDEVELGFHSLDLGGFEGLETFEFFSRVRLGFRDPNLVPPDLLKVFLRDQGIRHDIIDACLAMPGNDDLTLLVRRAEALSATLKTEDGANLLQGFKRANNILTQAEAKDGVEYSFGADPKFAEHPAETALFAALDAAEAKITPAMAQEDFAAAMQAMAQLRAPIDAFFTAVQVNADNPIVRRNRLNLLHRIRAICLSVADLTKIEG
jgi:glycyl-tRNA synthetase beta chain